MRSFIVVIVGLILCSSIYAQEKQVSPTYALSFGIADFFRLEKFNSSIAVKKIIDDTHQIRLFVSPSVSLNNNEVDIEVNPKKETRESFRLSLGIGVDYLWTLLMDDDVHMYGGTGSSFTYGYYRGKTITPTSSEVENTSETRTPSLNLGIRGILGVEWMVSKKIGIHSEYLLSGLYGWQKTDYKSNSLANPNRKTTGNTINLSSSVLFGVSIYL